MTTSVCIICQTNNVKYKCSKCRSPSCSLVCYKGHQASCSAISDILEIDRRLGDYLAASDKDQERSRHQSHIDDSLDVLFIQFPRLKSRLNEVYQTTLSRGPQSRTSHSGKHNDTRFPGNEKGWSPEQGFRQGLCTLQKALEDGGSDSEAIQAFVQLVTTTTAKSTS